MPTPVEKMTHEELLREAIRELESLPQEEQALVLKALVDLAARLQVPPPPGGRDPCCATFAAVGAHAPGCKGNGTL